MIARYGFVRTVGHHRATTATSVIPAPPHNPYSHCRFRAGGDLQASRGYAGPLSVGEKGVENAFAALLWQHMQHRQLASARRLSKAVRDFYTERGEPLLANLSAQKRIQRWIGARGKAHHLMPTSSSNPSQRVGQPQNVDRHLARGGDAAPEQGPDDAPPLGRPEALGRCVFANASLELGLSRVLQAWWSAAPHDLPTPLTKLIGRDDGAVELAELLTKSRGAPGDADRAGRVRQDPVGPGNGALPARHRHQGRLFRAPGSGGGPAGGRGGAAAGPGAAARRGRLPAAALGRASPRAARILLVLDNLEQPPGHRAIGRPARAGRAGANARVQSPTPRYLRRARACGLAIAVPDRSRSLTKLQENPAALLFAERARAVAPQFTLNRDNSEAVRQICTLLGGMPLAMRSSRRRGYAIVRPRIAPTLQTDARSRSGRAEKSADAPTIAAPGDRVELSPAHLGGAAPLRRLAVFRDGWPRQAIGPVCADGAPTDAAIGARLDALVAHALVIATPRVNGVRYRILEPLREYAGERLRERESLNHHRPAPRRMVHRPR